MFPANLIFAISIASSILTGCGSNDITKQLLEYCEKDGGNTVYETVKLQSKRFAAQGQVFGSVEEHSLASNLASNLANNLANKLGNDYFYAKQEQVMFAGDFYQGMGKLTKVETKITRRSDLKILGQSITYFREGGDGYIKGHPTANTCPKTLPPIENLVFVEQ